MDDCSLYTTNFLQLQESLNYVLSSVKRKVISTWHIDFSFPECRKIQDSAMAKKTSTAVNTSTSTQPISPLPLQFDYSSNLPHDDDDCDGNITSLLPLPSEYVFFKMTTWLLFVVWEMVVLCYVYSMFVTKRTCSS